MMTRNMTTTTSAMIASRWGTMLHFSEARLFNFEGRQLFVELFQPFSAAFLAFFQVALKQKICTDTDT